MTNENINQTRHLMNQQQVTTMKAIGLYDNLRSQVQPVPCLYADMVNMRGLGKLIPGQFASPTTLPLSTGQPPPMPARQVTPSTSSSWPPLPTH